MRRLLRRLGDVTGEELAAVEKAGAFNEPKRAAALLNVPVAEYRAFLERLQASVPFKASAPPAKLLWPALRLVPDGHQPSVPPTLSEAFDRVWDRRGNPAHKAGGVQRFQEEVEKEYGQRISRSTVNNHLRRRRGGGR